MHDHDSIDRASPMIEPDGPVVMTQSWDHLLFLHWSVPVADLQALIPADLNVDTFDGKAYSEDEHVLYRARIHHSPPRVQGATVSKVDETLVWATGVRRGEAAPLAHYVRSVESIRIYPPELCRA